MKVLLVSQSDLDGGAARATYRLHQSLQSTDIDARMLVQKKLSSDPKVIGASAGSGVGQIASGLQITLDGLPTKLYRDRTSTTYSVQWLPNTTARKINQFNPDVINLHWVQRGYLSINAVAQLSKPIVWTLHDMWAFTGGCHYVQECDRYLDTCGQCPQLGSHRQQDLSHWIWRQKAAAWKNLNLTIVTPSQWLADCARASSLLKNFRIECIPNSIDTQRYRPFERCMARGILGLPQDKLLILSGSLGTLSDKRKGFNLLQPALKQLSQSGWYDRAELLVFGAARPENPPDLGLTAHYLGSFSDDLTLALVYSAADVFVAPSVQDNLPSTVLEALACGTPCVAFNIGGMPDMIQHKQNGYLAKPLEPSDLAQGIAWILEGNNHQNRFAEVCRAVVEQKFTPDKQANAYLQLFSEMARL